MFAPTKRLFLNLVYYNCTIVRGSRGASHYLLGTLLIHPRSPCTLLYVLEAGALSVVDVGSGVPALIFG